MNPRVNLSAMMCVVIISLNAFSQDKSTEARQWVKIDDALMYSLVTATDRNQNVIRGLLKGMKGDSIYLYINKGLNSFDLKNIVSVSLEYNRKGRPGAVTGALSGMYLGSLLVLTSRHNSAKYLLYDGTSELVLYELLFLALGGGIGYLVDLGSEEGKKVFYFSEDEVGRDKQIAELEDFLTNYSRRGLLHLNFSLSQVNTTLGNLQNTHGDALYYFGYNYHGNEITSFNLLRKISLTIELSEKFEYGIALAWFGEPPVYYYKYYYAVSNPFSNTVTQTYEGIGYYALVNYRPLKFIIPDNIDILIGAGAGIGNVDYSYRSEIVTETYSGSISEVQESKIDKPLFSALFSLEIRFYIYPNLHVALQSDYIYMPQKMSAIPSLDLEKKNLGNFGFGFGFGINF